MPGIEPVVTPFFYLPLDPSAILTFQEKPICVVFSVFILGRGLAKNENELYIMKAINSTQCPFQKNIYLVSLKV